jgi:hypothetical protein
MHIFAYPTTSTFTHDPLSNALSHEHNDSPLTKRERVGRAKALFRAHEEWLKAALHRQLRPALPSS